MCTETIGGLMKTTYDSTGFTVHALTLGKYYYRVKTSQNDQLEGICMKLIWRWPQGTHFVDKTLVMDGCMHEWMDVR